MTTPTRSRTRAKAATPNGQVRGKVARPKADVAAASDRKLDTLLRRHNGKLTAEQVAEEKLAPAVKRAVAANTVEWLDKDSLEWTPEVARREAVEMEAQRLGILREARELAQARERAGTVVEPEVTRLDKFLATPDPEVTYRIDGLWPSGGRVVFVGGWKAGKSSELHNLIRSLVDGEKFLGHFEVETVERIVLIDDELDESMLRRWLREQGIKNTERVSVISLRGKVSSFDILTADGRKRWAERIGPADVLILDCLRPVLDAFGLDENHEAGRFLVGLDELLALAEISEAAIAHHMGHVGERGRGDSRLRDWPDVEWKLVRGKTDDSGDLLDAVDPRKPRYFSALGRDVDVPEGKLAYDQRNRRTRWLGGSRIDEHAEELIARVVAAIEADPGCSQSALEKAVGAHAEDVRKARDKAAQRELIHAGKVNGKWVHNPGSSNSSEPVLDERTTPSSTRPIEDEGSRRGEGEINSDGRTDEVPY